MPICAAPSADVRDSWPALFHAVHVVATPAVFGVGVAANLLALVVLSRSSARRESVVFVFLSCLALVDLVAVVCVAPTTIFKTETLPYEQLNSRLLASSRCVALSGGFMFKYASNWFVALSLCVARGGQRFSASRLVALCVVLLCVVTSLPRLFAVTAVPLGPECGGVWRVQATAFSRSPAYRHGYLLASLAGGVYLPTAVTAVVLVIVASRERGRPTTTTTTRQDAKRRQLAKTVVIMAAVSLALNTPETLMTTVEAAYEWPLHAGLTNWRIVCQLLTLIQLSVKLVVYLSINDHFRTTFRRTFCCCCNYERDSRTLCAFVRRQKPTADSPDVSSNHTISQWL